MLRIASVFLLLVILTACAASPTPTLGNAEGATPTLTATLEPQVTPTTQVPLPAEWAGAITHADGTSDTIVVQFAEGGGELKIEPFTKAYKIEDVQQSASMVSFDTTVENRLHFSGEFEGSQLSGQVEGNDQKDSFTLLPLFSASKVSLNDFPGTYQFESGESLLINPAPEYSSSGLYFFGQGLMATHFGTGAIRALYPLEQDKFLVGSARAIGYPFSEQITFTRGPNGAVNGLTWQTRDPNTGQLGEAAEARRLALKSELVQFTSEDGTQLAGLLTLPAGPGPYPAIMMIHGSEAGTKDDFGDQQMSAFMASQGIAILTYDRRGAGDSGGHYAESASKTNLDLTARDAIAGVEYLKSRPEIRGDEIGLTGFSQAGWVIPIAASLSQDVSYFIILSGPVTSVGHESLYSSFTSNGDSPSTDSQEELMDRLARSPHSGFDSTPVIATLAQRGLWIFGDQDMSIPVPESVDNLKAIIARGRPNFTYAVLPDADHNLQQTTQGLFNEIPYAPGYQGDYYKTMVQWLEENVK
jgi:dienelactone hydrolase